MGMFTVLCALCTVMNVYNALHYAQIEFVHKCPAGQYLCAENSTLAFNAQADRRSPIRAPSQMRFELKTFRFFFATCSPTNTANDPSAIIHLLSNIETIEAGRRVFFSSSESLTVLTDRSSTAIIFNIFQYFFYHIIICIIESNVDV